MVNKLIKQFLILFSLIFILTLPYFVFAQNPMAGLSEVGSGSGYEAVDENSIGSIMSVVIKAFLGLLAIIFLVIVVINGFKWMTAGGNEDKVKEAKHSIERAIIGLIIIAAAYSITYFVFNALARISSGSTGSGSLF